MLPMTTVLIGVRWWSVVGEEGERVTLGKKWGGGRCHGIRLRHSNHCCCIHGSVFCAFCACVPGPLLVGDCSTEAVTACTLLVRQSHKLPSVPALLLSLSLLYRALADQMISVSQSDFSLSFFRTDLAL